MRSAETWTAEWISPAAWTFLPALPAALGNLFEQTLEEILRGERAAAMAAGFAARKPTEELCRRCGYARRFRK